MFSLEGRHFLVVGVANHQSIAWACAETFHRKGAKVAVTYLNERAEPHVRRLAEPLMPNGGACMTVTFCGSEKVVDNDYVMGPVKAALESVVRYSATELRPQGISVHALSPGPLKTRAASGIADLDELLEAAAARAPTQQLATIEDVGAYADYLASREAANVTGGVHPIDGGFSIRV